MSGFVGRRRERAVLLEAIEAGGPLAVFVHGPAGIGKSSLLSELCDEAERRGARVVRLDCRAFEPTERGFLDALGEVLGETLADPAAAAKGLAALGDRVVFALDTYEVLRLADPWLRGDLLPALDDAVAVVVAGREPPVSAWSEARGDARRFRSLLLGPLEDADALDLIATAHLTADEARAVNRVARGHPLALRVAALALQEQPGRRVDETAIPRAVEELVRLYLDGVDAGTRRTLDAASVVRRVTRPLLAAMLPDLAADEALERLTALPFVDLAGDGLRMHEAVQSAIATRLRAVDPDAQRAFRAAAWRWLRREVRDASRHELWRYTADMLYLIENPVVREAFFPTTAHLYVVDQARPEDADALLEIVRRHETADGADVLEEWWRAYPQSFRAVRDRSGEVVGLSIVAEAPSVPAGIARKDPVVAAWREHLRTHPVGRGERVLYHRRGLDRELGEAPGPVQAATWLDVKRYYMELRPELRRLYSALADPTPYVEALLTLGFEPFPAPVELHGRPYQHCALLDFGPGSVDGWLAGLAAAELGIAEEQLVDPVNRELVLDGDRVPLTPLEFGVLQLLAQRQGEPVKRVDLLAQVWGLDAEYASNVVDVVVRSLRKKLGARSSMIETVRGVGYRYRPG